MIETAVDHHNNITTKAGSAAVKIVYAPAKPNPWILIVTCVLPTIAMIWGYSTTANYSGDLMGLGLWILLTNMIGPLCYPAGRWLARHWIILSLLAVGLLFVAPWLVALSGAILIISWPAWAVFQCRSYFDHKIVLSEIGMRLPLKTLDHPYWNETVPWSKIRSINCETPMFHQPDDFDPDADPLTDHSLTIKTSSLGRLSIELKYLNASQRQSLFSAIKDWAAPSSITQDLIMLIQNLPKLPDAIASHPSYTKVWEKDLQNHLNATIYVPLQIGQKIKQYTVNKCLASGGQATTYLATDEAAKPVVLKEYLVPHNVRGDARDQLTKMFEREYQILKNCNHKQIAKVLDHFTEADRNYLVLENIPGDNARKRIQLYGVLSNEDAMSVAQQLTEILSYLHRATPPILHRDLSPDNIIIDESLKVCLIDFGAANELISNVTGTAIGKQAYVAPEQFRGKACEASDIYSLGCCLHYLLTSKEPVPLSESHPRLTNATVTCELDDLIGKCTAQDLANHRILDARDLANRLNKLISEKRIISALSPKDQVLN